MKKSNKHTSYKKTKKGLEEPTKEIKWYDWEWEIKPNQTVISKLRHYNPNIDFVNKLKDLIYAFRTNIKRTKNVNQFNIKTSKCMYEG